MMRLISTLAIAVLFLGFTPTRYQTPTSKILKAGGNFHDYKNVAKLIDAISQNLMCDSTSFEYGTQGYKRYKISSATAFYNQPTDILHYVLLTRDKRSFHFEIPMLFVEATAINSNGKELEVRSQMGHSIFIKEYTPKGGLIFSLGYSVVKLPLCQTSTQALPKNFAKIIKRSAKFKVKYSPL